MSESIHLIRGRIVCSATRFAVVPLVDLYKVVYIRLLLMLRGAYSLILSETYGWRKRGKTNGHVLRARASENPALSHTMKHPISSIYEALYALVFDDCEWHHSLAFRHEYRLACLNRDRGTMRVFDG